MNIEISSLQSSNICLMSFIRLTISIRYNSIRNFSHFRGKPLSNYEFSQIEIGDEVVENSTNPLKIVFQIPAPVSHTVRYKSTHLSNFSQFAYITIKIIRIHNDTAHKKWKSRDSSLRNIKI